jgi:hypothetical protein
MSPIIHGQSRRSFLVAISLHIETDLVKQFVMAMDQNGNVFLHLKQKFLRIVEAKIKEGISVRPQIKETCETLSETEGAAWRAFKPVTTNLPGKFKAENYEQLTSRYL